LQRRAVVVAIGVEADISCLAEFDDLVENDPGRVETPFIPQKLQRMGVVHVDVTV
jgi:hypothetical protein